MVSKIEYKGHSNHSQYITRKRNKIFKPSIWSLYDQDAANFDILQTDSWGFEP